MDVLDAIFYQQIIPDGIPNCRNAEPQNFLSAGFFLL
jgi:hypothetical protein